jgi:hypothetical protein
LKDEGSNLNTMIVALKAIISCDNLSLEESYQGTCFGHAFSKAYQYATMDQKVCKNFEIYFYKDNIRIFTKMYNLIQTYGKGCQK